MYGPAKRVPCLSPGISDATCVAGMNNSVTGRRLSGKLRENTAADKTLLPMVRMPHDKHGSGRRMNIGEAPVALPRPESKIGHPGCRVGKGQL